MKASSRMDLSRAYSDDLSRVKILSHEECLALHERARRASMAMANGKKPRRRDLKARNLLVESCLRLACKRAFKFVSKDFDLADLVEHANIECMKAVDRWDPERAKLSTVVTTYVKKGLLRLVTEDFDGGIYVPHTTRKVVAELGEKKVCAVDIAATMKRVHPNLAIQRARDIMSARAAMRLTPISKMKREHDDREFDFEFVENLKDFDHVDLIKRVKRALKNLPEQRTRDILRRRFGIGKYEAQTLEEIADHYKVSRERVRQITIDAFERMRKFIEPSISKPPQECEFCEQMFVKKKSKQRFCCQQCSKDMRKLKTEFVTTPLRPEVVSDENTEVLCI